MTQVKKKSSRKSWGMFVDGEEEWLEIGTLTTRGVLACTVQRPEIQNKRKEERPRWTAKRQGRVFLFKDYGIENTDEKCPI